MKTIKKLHVKREELIKKKYLKYENVIVHIQNIVRAFLYKKRAQENTFLYNLISKKVTYLENLFKKSKLENFFFLMKQFPAKVNTSSKAISNVKLTKSLINALSSSIFIKHSFDKAMRSKAYYLQKFLIQRKKVIANNAIFNNESFFFNNFKEKSTILLKINKFDLLINNLFSKSIVSAEVS